MTPPALDSPLAPLEPLDPQLTSIQPGGGVCMSLELAWGRFRRAWLKTFRPGYVARMAALRKGVPGPYPHEILDPRDLKFYRNQTGYWWDPVDDPFAWRDRLPFARAGLTELWLLSGAFFAIAAAAGWFHWALAIVPVFLGLCIVWFFRNPRRVIPADPNLVVSPADGTVVEIKEVDDDPFLGGPGVQIGIFLSVFNVHINRSPFAGRVVGLTYRKGKFLNALLAASARENEQLAVRLQQTTAPHRRFVVRQIAGAIARRIVCWVKPGDQLAAGEQFGMIKLGSRTELLFPREVGLEIRCRLGQKIKAGTTVLAAFEGERRS
jgi:phosphatidylserine decarboxylase